MEDVVSFHILKSRIDVIKSDKGESVEYCLKVFSLENISEILKDLKLFKIEVSFGSINTKIDPHIFYKNNISYLRISIGYDDTINNLILGFGDLINKINNAYK